MRKVDYLYIDPQAKGNCCRYDYNLLKNIDLPNMAYITNVSYDAPPLKHLWMIPYFRYLEKSKISKGFSYLYSIFKVFVFILLYRPKIVHINWIRIPRIECAFYRLLRFFVGCKVLYVAHNVLPHDTKEKHKAEYISFYKMVDCIIVHCKSTKKEIVELGIDGKKIFVSRHGLITREELGNESFDFKAKYNLQNKMVFSISGVQSKYKGSDIVIDAWLSNPRLRNSRDVALVFMGKNEGIDFEEIRKLENVVVLDRYFSDAEQSALFESTDVLLLPYRKISQSGVLLTAISFNIPSIVSDVGGLAEAFDVETFGWKMESVSPNDLSKMMQYALENRNEVEKIKNDKYMWSRLQDYYGWPSIGLITKQLYFQINRP